MQNGMNSILQGLEAWQTLVGATLAVLATFGTILATWLSTRRQLKAQRSEAESQRHRRLMACRAVMSADLSEVVRYAQICAELSRTMHQVIDERDTRQNLECPTLPERVIGNIQMIIEYLDEKNAHAVSEILRCYQVQYARMIDVIETYNNPLRFGVIHLLTIDNIETTLEKTVELHLRATGAFEFAREEAEEIQVLPFEKSEIENSLGLLRIDGVISLEYKNILIKFFSSSS